MIRKEIEVKGGKKDIWKNSEIVNKEKKKIIKKKRTK